MQPGEDEARGAHEKWGKTTMKVWVVQYETYQPAIAVFSSEEECHRFLAEQMEDGTITEMDVAAALEAIGAPADDYEGAHEALDTLLCVIARGTGYSAVADAWEAQGKWFS